MKTQDLKDIKKYMKENSKWYWYIPVIGFFTFQMEITAFALQNGMVINAGTMANSNYDYEQVNGELKYRSKGLDTLLKRMKKIHIYTLGISFIIMIALEICLFNFGPLIMKSLSNKIIAENK